MKDFLTGTNVILDLVIIGVLVVLVWISGHITPLTYETVTNGSFFLNLWTFFLGKVPDVPWMEGFLSWLKNAIAVLTVLMIAGIFWLSFRLKDLHHAEEEKYAPINTAEIEEKEKTAQWQVIQDHLNSENSAEWKLAILEADNMLDQVLEAAGYHGESLGERLKAMDPSDLPSYQDAWTAHKMRNEIAHEGAITMDFSKKMARDTIAKFEQVFKDLGVI